MSRTSPCSRPGSAPPGVVAQPTPFVYEVFDLLYLDGRSLLDEPLEDADAGWPASCDPRVRLSEHIVGDGMAFFEAARVRGLEGIMAKDRRSPYLPGERTDRWQKVKIRPEQELVVGGWAKGTGTAVDLGALLVGVYEDGGLRYAGKVGAGFTDSRAELLAALAPLAADVAAVRDAATGRRGATHSGSVRARDPGRVRRLDRRRPRPPGRLQGPRPREGPAQGDPGASEGVRRLRASRC